MSDDVPRPQQGDEHELFVKYADKLHAHVKRTVRTTPEIIDDACAFAWMKLVSNQPDRATIFPWLSVVARNKAIELDRMSHRTLGIDAILLAETLVSRDRGASTKQGLLEVEERLSQLNPRQRAMVFLQAAGWRYSEIAEDMGVSQSRVNGVLVQAREKFRQMDLREMEPTGPRARRLRAIEASPPQYIVASIGRQPRVNRRTGGEQLRREWKRLVLQIEDYRAANGVTDRVLPIGRNGVGPQYETLKQHISEYRRDRGLSVGLEL